MSGDGDSLGQTTFLAALRERDIDAQLVLFIALLKEGFESEVNCLIPSEGQTPLQLSTRELDDDRLEFFKLLLQCADISEMHRDGESLFDCLVPVQWRKLGMLYELLETIEEPERLVRILASVLSTAAAEVKQDLEYRLPTMYPNAWAILKQRAEKEGWPAETSLE